MAVAAVAMLATGDGATAASCQGLKRELASLSGGGGGSVREASAALAVARAQARQAGCLGGFLFFRRKAQPVCHSLMPRVRHLEAQVARGGRGGAASIQRRASTLRQRIAAACGRERIMEASLAAPAPKRGPRRVDEARVATVEAAVASSLGGTFRTMCVRTCDGYYFPISFSTTRDRFAADEAVCQAACPGTEVALYYHDDPTGEADGMLSLSDRPYAELPTAFRHRSAMDKACACGAPARTAMLSTPGDAAAPKSSHTRGFTLIATDEPATGEADVLAPSAPRQRPDAPFADPETLVNAATGLSLDALAELKGAVNDAPAGGRIRQVGPLPPVGGGTVVLLQVPGPRKGP